MPVGAVSSRPSHYTPTARAPGDYRPAPSLSSVEGGRPLSLGHRGSAVREVQQKLNDAGIQPPLKTDGMYGPNTDAAVRAFQQLNGLTQDGLAGPRTLAALRSGATFEPAEVSNQRNDARATVGAAGAEAPPPSTTNTPTRPVRVSSGLQNSPEGGGAPQSKLDQLLADNPGMQTNQDLINHAYREGGGSWAGASQVAASYGRDLNQLTRHRSDPIVAGRSGAGAPASGAGSSNANATAATASSPVTNPGATGADLETFPIAGGRYNVGYDSNWNNFDAQSARHNSDYSIKRTNANHPNGHLGVDIFAPRGQPVVSPVTGVVESVRRNSRVGGNNVTIRRGNHRYYMAHMDSLADGLRPGQSIRAGEPIGAVGNTGSARGTAPHVHFSIFEGQGGYYRGSINPFPHMQGVLPN